MAVRSIPFTISVGKRILPLIDKIMLEKSAKKHLETFKNKHILVIGDLMLDEYHWCSVSRISPEAPVPVCKVEKTTLVPGGAANVAYNILSLGSSVSLFGFIGNDSTGEKLINLLNEKKINTSGIIKTTQQPTILKSRIVAGQQHIVRVDRENSAPFTRATYNKLVMQIEEKTPSADAILISDYLKGTLTDSVTQQIIQIAKKHNKPVIVDPKGDKYTKYKGATVLTPNFSEFKAVTKKQYSTEKEIQNEGLKLVKKLKLESLLVTRSEKGMSLLSNGIKTDIPTRAQEVFDITGAGDTAIAMLSVSIANGFKIEEASFLANAAAGLVVAKVGTSITTLKEIQESLNV